MMRDVGILGGGISGLFLAHFLGGDVEVLEASDCAGGLARSFGGAGFRSDIGGHILFSQDKEALAYAQAALGDNRRQVRRVNKILYVGQHVKYPFENGIGALSVSERVEILQSFIDNPHDVPGKPPANFREWLLAAFGAGIAHAYLCPYNEKIWKTDLAAMSTEWVGRVPRIDAKDLLRTALGVETEGYTHQLDFDYPKLGGFEALPRALASKLAGKVTTNFRVASVKRSNAGFVVFGADGEARHYRTLVSAIPVTVLLDALGNAPDGVLRAARGLRFNSLRVVLVGVRGPLPMYTALYVPSAASLYHRLCFNRAFASDAVPRGCSSVSCEVTAAPGSELDTWSDEKLAARVVDDLCRDRVVDRVSVCFTQVHRERLAYVVHDHSCAERLAVVHGFTDACGIHLAGRFAQWRYINTDACVRRALDLARQLRGGEIAPEARL